MCESHFSDHSGAVFVVASNRHNDFPDLTHVERVVENCRKEFRREPTLDCNVTPDALMVPVLVYDAGNDLATLESDCLTAFCKVPAAHTPRNPFSDFNSLDNFTQRTPPPSNTRSVATHCN